jgi:hypothetical protein
LPHSQVVRQATLTRSFLWFKSRWGNQLTKKDKEK